ncbi:MAG: InlB B-repeat-containing protein [Dethiobacteria bacterium]
MPAEDLTLVAQWEINQYTISFDSAGGTEVAAITLDYGETVTPPANPTKTGYTFKGWDPIVPSTMPAENLTLVAQWEINQYTITFDSVSGTPVASIAQDYGTDITPPADPTREGYTFKGWDPIVPSTMPAEDLTLVAQWEINQYTISFNSAGGSLVDSITQDYGTDITPPADPTREGYTFKGWDPIVPSTMPAENLTLVAQWEINQYTISFNSAGGSLVDSITQDYGTDITPPADPTREGYTFKGWDPIVPSTMPAEDLTLVAQWEINQYTISFDSAGGTEVAAITLDYGETVTPPANPTKTGYTFKGWDPIVPSTMPAKDLTLVAQWEINQYTITFDSVSGTPVASIAQDYGTDITPPADPTREGYTFKGWDPIVPSTMPAEDLTLVAQWEINQYTISFDSAGGTEVAAITLDYGETVTPPANPTKTGYTFKGWDPIVPSTMPAEDLTLVAQWEINQYTISFDSAGGTEVAAITLDYGKTVTPPANPTKTGYTFKGWDPIVPSTMPAENLTLVAQWEINQYTISFNSAGGTEVAAITLDYGETVTPPANPTKTGYTFKGWDPIVPSTMPAEDLTLVAQWEINQYTISFNSAGGSLVDSITQDYGTDITPPADPTREGYTFKGWDPIVPSTMPAEDLTLVAQWEINQYTISFNSAGGSLVDSITQDYGTDITPPADPTREGYTFKGWDPIVPSTMPAENLTLVAQWEINQYMITFDSAGGTEVAAITLDYGETVTPPANPTKTGYTFKGWDPIVPSTMPAEDLTLVAQWEINQYTISFDSAGGTEVAAITLDYGETVTPPANPTKTGYTFKGWDPIVPSTMPAKDLTLVAQWEINQYTITFDSVSGTPVASIAQDYGTDITPPADPTREGYTFKGWDPIVPSTMPAEDLTLVAQWEINQYTISFDSAGGTEVAAITLDYGETVTPPANPTKTGYTFKGWDPIVPSTMPAEDLTLVAQWEINQYTISFDSAGGTEVAAITLDYGETVTPPANPTKTGYTFKGWDPIVPSTMPAENLTLVAQWEINQYTISFNSAGGTEVAAITLDYGETVTPPANPTKTGYTFKGWDPIVPSTMPAEDLTLVAQWEINQYTISFNSAGGSLVDSITQDYGTDITPPADPTREGYTFKGWDPIVPSTMPAEDLTLVAQWEINQYTISFNSAGGSLVDSITQDYGTDITPPADPTREGYTFKGWDPIVPSTMPAENLTLVAQWEINQYMITFDSAGGTEVAAITLDYGETVTPPANPTKTGYTFKGWDPIVPSTMPAEALTLVAQWEINQYTISFDSAGGTEVAAITLDYGKTVTPPANPTKTGYTFKGWDPIVPSTMPAEDLTLVAQWEINQYTISFDSAGGTEVAAITLDYGKTVTPPANPTKTGYTFKGWDPIVPSTMPAEDLTLVAQWEINQYTISFDSAGGTEVAAITLDYGKTVTPPANPTKTGYTFKGWDPIVPSTMPAENLTLVAQWEINQYTISFDSAGGTEVAAITLDYGETVTPPANPTKTGYTFKGWDPIVPSTMPAKDLTLVAQWEINQYTITFDSVSGTPVASIAQDYGTDITPPADPTREGYTFKGWDPIVPSTMPAEDLTLVAQWEINQYTITFDSVSGTPVASIAQDYGTDITPPADPTREGYTFKGWDPIVPSTMPAEDLTLVAQWEINQYTISFNSAGGSLVDSITQDYGTDITPPADPTREGYTFKGWDPIVPSTMPAENLTLVAQWEINQYTISFNSAGGSLVDSITQDYGTDITPPADPTREGYTFKGWDPIVPSTMPAEDLTLVAQWEINQYTISFNSAGGTEVAAITLDYGETVTPPANPTKTGYTFKGWDPIVPSTMPAEDLTLVAQWEINQYTISFNSAGGSLVDSITQDYGTDITPPADPTREGYTFKGWDPIVPSTMPAEDLTLVAQWEINQYTISFNSAGGSLVDSITQDYGTDITPPADPTREGYTFKGWDPIVPSTMPAEDLTLVAQWEINQYMITFDSAGGSTVVSQTVNYGGKVIKPADPTKTEHTFEGWFTDENLSHAWNFDNDTVTADTTLYAKWEVKRYTITFVVTPADASLVVKISGGVLITPEPDGTYKLAKGNYNYTASAEGYVAETKGFPVSGDKTVTINLESEVAFVERLISSLPAVGNLTLDNREAVEVAEAAYDKLSEDRKAQVSQALKDKLNDAVEKITELVLADVDDRLLRAIDDLDYDAGGGTGIEIVNYEERTATFLIKDPTKQVYLFAFSGVIPLFEAMFEDVKFYRLNDGSLKEVSGDTLQIAIDIVCELLGLDPNNLGELMSKTLADLVGRSINIELTIQPGSRQYVETYQVKFELVKYDLTYTAGANGSISGAVEQTVEHGGNGTAVTAEPNLGYHFVRWSDGSTANPRTDTNVTSDISVTAEFAINKYTVTFKDHDAVLKTETVEHGKGAAAPENPTREGYTFSSWDKDFTNVTSDLVVTAWWTANIYTVTFDALGGTDPEAKQVTYDSAYGDLPTPEKMGYCFAGWFTASTGGDEITTGTIMTTAGDHKLYAQWNASTYTVTFDANGGDAASPASKTVTYAETYGDLATTTRVGYSLNGWFTVASGGTEVKADTPVTITANQTLYAQWAIETYNITYELDGGTNDLSNPSSYTIETADITLAAAIKEGYVFDGWYDAATGGNLVTSISQGSTGDMTLYARYTDLTLAELKGLIDDSTGRTRPGYTASIVEWDTYWGQFCTALTAAEGVYDTLKEVGTLTPDQMDSLTTAKTDLQRAVEILNGIEDFDAALGGRQNPLGLVETVYARSLVADSFQPGRLRCYYEKEESYLYWLMSGFVQEQGYYAGTTGTGMNQGLQNVMLSEDLIRMESCGRTVYIYHPDGTRKTKKELEGEGINLALQWISSDPTRFTTYTYADFAGFEVLCQLVGKTSSETGGTEFTRSYTFQFVDAGIHLFEPYFRYCVENGAVQRVFGDYSIINATQNISYTDSTIQAAIDAANPGDMLYVANGTFSESVTINKSITLIGNYMAGSGSFPTVVDGSTLGNVSGFQIAAGVSDVTIAGFEVKDFASGGIVAQGAGIDNVKIEKNYIHNVGADGICGSAGGPQALSGWTVSHNTIKDYGGSGISLANAVDSTISENIISNPKPESAAAIDVAGRASSGSVTVSGVTIAGNEVTGDDVRVTATGTGSGAATTQNITVSGNTVTEGAIVVLADAQDSSSATVKGITINGNTISGDTAGIDLGKKGSGTAVLQNFIISGNSLALSTTRWQAGMRCRPG